MQWSAVADEFAILQPNIRDRSELKALAERFSKQLSAPEKIESTPDLLWMSSIVSGIPRYPQGSPGIPWRDAGVGVALLECEIGLRRFRASKAPARINGGEDDPLLRAKRQ